MACGMQRDPRRTNTQQGGVHCTFGSQMRSRNKKAIHTHTDMQRATRNILHASMQPWTLWPNARYNLPRATQRLARSTPTVRPRSNHIFLIAQIQRVVCVRLHRARCVHHGPGNAPLACNRQRKLGARRAVNRRLALKYDCCVIVHAMRADPSAPSRVGKQGIRYHRCLRDSGVLEYSIAGSAAG
jgi:hypothetical protein